MVEKRIKNINILLQKYIHELEKHVRVERVILFGSYSRGEPRDYSDIDVAIFSPDFKGGTEEDYLLLDRIARRINSFIEAIPYRSQDLKDFEPGDFLDEILKTGRVIYKKAA